ASPMVIRIAGLAYQKGFGGHFHNDNSLTALRDLPGVIIACPSNGEDAVQMLREATRLAHEERKIVFFIEPIALYMTKDLYESGDQLWTFSYEEPRDEDLKDFRGHRVYETEKADLAIISYGNGLYYSLQAQKELRESHQIGAKV